ncbi:MAG TPA: Abi-alpha family protein [Planctomycetota bacterium]|nr:Abi-alpha family protein [Planctomycetota bacterium]
MDWLTNAGDEAKAFFSSITGLALEHHSVAGTIAAYRAKNALKAYENARQKLKADGIDPRRIDFKVLFPILQHAGDEDNESLHEKWATLLANAANPRAKVTVRPDFVAALAQMTPKEAALVDWLYELEDTSAHKGKGDCHGITFKEISDKFFPESAIDTRMAIDNLIRLRICRAAQGSFTNLIKGGMTLNTISAPDTLVPTDYGRAFHTACTWGK